MAMRLVCPRFGPNGEECCFRLFLDTISTVRQCRAVERQGLVERADHIVPWSATKRRTPHSRHHDFNSGSRRRFGLPSLLKASAGAHDVQRMKMPPRFTALLHHVDVAAFERAYLPRQAAPGVDG
nr:hypothetical protein BDOA9_0162060 [Bradyrhizobium sp. DOA9]